KQVLKGVVPGIREADFVLLWGGGIWNWFDPLTLIRAVARIAGQRDDVKLFFLGVRHPDPLIEEMAMAAQAVALADELGLTGRHEGARDAARERIAEVRDEFAWPRVVGRLGDLIAAPGLPRRPGRSALPALATQHAVLAGRALAERGVRGAARDVAGVFRRTR